MKKFSVLFLLSLGLLFVNLFPTVEVKVSGERVPVKARKHGGDRINLRDGFTVPTDYAGEAAQILENNAARALSLTTADFDEDGMPDLIAGYAGNSGGIVAVHRGNIDLLFPKNPNTDEFVAPFLSPAKTFVVPQAADFIGAGDFDADGHWDLVTAARGGDKLFLLAGDGRGGFNSAKERKLSGAVTAFTTGELNRRDGLTDIVIGVDGNKPQALVLESPDGAFRAAPEFFDLPDAADGFTFGQFDEYYAMDLAVAAGRNLIFVHGRDRKLSLDAAGQAEVDDAKLTRRDFDFDIKAITTFDCGMRNAECGIALLGADGAIHFLKSKSEPSAAADGFIETSAIRLPMSQTPEMPSLIPVSASGQPTRELIVLDQNNKQLHIIIQKQVSENPQSAIRNPQSAVVSLDVSGEPSAVLPMRLNKDALSDLVVLQRESIAPAVALTAPQAIFIVNSTGDEPDTDTGDGVCLTSLNTCTFIAATQQANATVAADEIRFALTGAEPFILNSGGAFTNPVTVDGYTQSGASQNTLANGDNAVLKIQRKGPGSLVGGSMTFNGSGSVLRGLVANNYCGSPALIAGGAGNHIVEGNFFGIDVTGSVSSCGNISVESAGNLIGGTTPQARNVISGSNTFNLSSFGGTVANNLVQGNFIGTDRNGTSSLTPNGSGVLFPSNNNTIGGTTAGARNVISGNSAIGIELVSGPAGNLVQGNFIGVNVTGGARLSNGTSGINMGDFGGNNNTIGGTTPTARNIISANGGNGIQLGGNELIQSNYIGTDVTGTITDPDGVPNNGDELGNAISGIITAFGGNNNTIGGTSAEARNVISGNRQHGIFLDNGNGHLIQGNYIGTDVTGTLARGNATDGVQSFRPNTTVGGTTAGARNVISANGRHGVAFFFQPTDILVQGNYIGLQADGASPLGNGLEGVHAETDRGLVGGTASGAGNRIAFNGGDGVRVRNGHTCAILSNSIYLNNLLGIEIEAFANNDQTAPMLTLASSGAGNTTVAGTLSSVANTTFRLEFFNSPVADPSGNGEGETFIGSINVTTDAGGNAAFNQTFAFNAAVNSFVTATATRLDAMSNPFVTSEFSNARQVFAPTAASVTVGGQVKTALGRGIGKARITMIDATGEMRVAFTNPFGYFRFTDVPAGETYIFNVRAKHYSFSQPTQIRSIFGETDNIIFVADN